MAKQTKRQQEIVGRVMHEFHHGELETSHGRKVKNPQQAKAIALSEAGASNQQSKDENRRQRSRTEQKEHKGLTARQLKEGQGPTKAELYEEAKKQDIRGRSRMSKAELTRAVA